MSIKKNRDYLQKLDEFLACFDPEELIRDGVQLIRFRYQKKNKKEIVKTFTPDQLREERAKRCNF
jgi:hypothetical protein